MHVFISKQCQQEAKDYRVEQKIQELADWVRSGDLQKFFELFGRFQHPYYVRKGIGYRYRLVVKVVEVDYQNQSHPVIVFFRIFIRSSSDYKTLFHQADQNGDFFYNQQCLDNEIFQYIKSILTDRKSEPLLTSKTLTHNDSLNYLMQAKVNQFLLNKRQMSEEYYQEHSSWIFGVRPLLDDAQLEQVFEHIGRGLESQQLQSFSVAGNELQFQPSQLLLSQNGNGRFDPFSRYLPVDSLLEKTAWLQYQQQRLPLYLNEFQQTVCDTVFFNNDSFPLLVNSPENHGKTSLLAVLTAHYLLQPIDESYGILPVLLLCETHEKHALKTAIFHYICYQQSLNPVSHLNLDSLYQKINRCCMDMMDLLKTFNPSSINAFDEDKFIDRYQFGKLWKKAPFIKNQQLSHIPVDLAWFVIQHLIKGERGLLGEGRAFSDRLNSHSGLSCELYQQIYEEVWRAWYQPLTEDEFWDYQDALSAVNTNADFSQRYAAILVDNAENQTHLAYQVLMRCCAWWDNPKLLPAAPIVFMGNSQANIPYQLFNWQDELNTLLHRLYQYQTDGETFATQRINYIADFVSQSHYAVQSQRSKTNLIKFTDSISQDTLLVDTEILFVDAQDDELTQALLLSQNIPLIVNSEAKDDANLLKQSKYIGHWFDFAHTSQIDIPRYSLATLPIKHHSIALMNFVHQDFSCFKDKEDSFGFLSFEQRYQLSAQLDSLRQAMQQGLKRIFILGHRHELPLWQGLFCSALGSTAIRFATIQEINPNFLQERQQLAELEQQALDNQDIEQIFAVAQHYYQRLQYPKYFYLLLKGCEFSADYADYFEHLLTESQKQLTFDYLWQQQQSKVILDYHEFMPKATKNNLMALRLIEGVSLDTSFANAFIIATNQYAKQYNLPAYQDFWQSVFAQILALLLVDDLEAQWSLIGKQLYKLRDLGISIPSHILAMSHYQQQETQKALALWQQVERHDASITLPKVYYELMLQDTKSWQEQTIILLKLKQLGDLMNVLTANDLNELQLSYWDKILPYLFEEDELEPVLLTLLPQVHNQEILDRIYDYCQFDASDNFMTRLQRLKTVQACLTGDWAVVIERLEHYLPVQDGEEMLTKLSQAFTTKKIGRGPKAIQKTVMRNKLPKPQDEVVDILYALNLNSEIHTAMTAADFEHYRQQPYIKRIFDLIRQILSVQSGENIDEIAWNIDFPAMRSLAYLLEKSDNIADALSFYSNVANFSSDKKLTIFAIERLYVLVNRAKQLLADGLNISDIGETDDLQSSEDLTASIGKLEKHFEKLLKKVKLTEDVQVLPPLKSTEEVIKSILALTQKEHREIQRLEKEQREAAKQKEEEAKRQALASQQLAEQQEKIAQALTAKQKAAAKLEQEKIQATKIEQERLEQERLEQEQLNQKKLEQETRQETVSQESQAVTDADSVEQSMPSTLAYVSQVSQNVQLSNENESTTPNVETYNQSLMEVEDTELKMACSKVSVKSSKRLSYKATTELHFFNWRIFVNRLHQRLNIEDGTTGERCSLYLAEQRLQSDWGFVQHENGFEFSYLPLRLNLTRDGVVLTHIEHGAELSVAF